MRGTLRGALQNMARRAGARAGAAILTCLVLGAGMGMGSAAANPPFTPRTVAGWEISLNKNGLCMMGARYRFKPGVETQLFFAFSDNNQLLQIIIARSDWAMPVGATYEVGVAVDLAWYQTGVAKVLTENGFSVILPASQDALGSVMQGAMLYIETGRSRLSFTMEGVPDAMPVLVDCALTVKSYNEARGSNPFGDGGANPFANQPARSPGAGRTRSLLSIETYNPFEQDPGSPAE